MSLRKFDMDDLDLCIDMYLDFVNAQGRGKDDPWTENAVAERLKGILESPVFAGYALEEDGTVKGFLLGIYSTSREGAAYEVLELFCAAGMDLKATASAMLQACVPLVKEAKIQRLKIFSSDLWAPDFFAAQGFRVNELVKLFERAI